MQPIVEPGASTGLRHRLAITALVGISVLSVVAVVMLATYVDRISEMASGLHRVDALADYPGRPVAVQVAESPAVNFLIFVDSGQHLQAVVIASLSGSRRDLTLVALPADLLNSDSGQSLDGTYASSPLQATQLVEKITGARMDHQLQLQLTGFGAVIDGLDGLRLADQQLSGVAAVSYLADAPSSADRSQRAAQLIRQSMIEGDADGGVLNLARFDRVIGALGDCLTIDNGLTNDAIQSILVESRVHLSEVGLWPVSGVSTNDGTQGDPTSLALLRVGLANDAMAVAQRSAVNGTARVGTAVRSQSTAETTSAEPDAQQPTVVITSTQDQAPSPTASVGDESLSPSTASGGGEISLPSASAQTSR